MLLTLTTTHAPASDLGYLLHKNPANVHERDLAFGVARVCFPEASDERCTAALMVDVDPIALVRDRKRGPKGDGFSLAQYVNDRPYAASSFLAVAITKMLGTAMSGRSKERPELAETALPFDIRIPVVPCRGGTSVLERVFGPLGYTIAAAPIPLDPAFPEWGDSRYLDVTLTGTRRLREVLEHLFVLLPVLDDDKHYWVGRDEIDKLLAKGEGWLSAHPDVEFITDRYLKRQRHLTREALARLSADDTPDPDAAEERHAAEEANVEAPLRLNEERIASVVSVLRSAGSKRVLDLGCGEGQLVQALLKDPAFEQVTGVDVSVRSLETAARRLRLKEMHETQRSRVQLLHGSLVYRDARLAGFDAGAIVEVIEHLDPSRLASFERVVFEHARPATVVVTTPNREYNVRFLSLPPGRMRHRDHRFEWSRAEFLAWAERVASAHGYSVRLLPVGRVDPEVGPPTQMAVLSR